MSDDWLSRYLRMTERQEAPELFHLWVGVSCISAALQRRVWMNRGFYRLYPNFYIILVAPSGRCRKTTAADIGVGMLRDAGIHVISEKITAAGLLQHLGDQIVVTKHGAEGEARAFIYAGELSVFLGKDATTTGLIPTLTSLYGCPDRWEYITKMCGKDFLFNVWISLLGASSPEWLKIGLTMDNLSGGFSARVIFVVQSDTPRKEPHPIITREQVLIREELVRELVWMGELRGEVRLSEEADEAYREWYEDDGRMPEDPRMLSFYEREHDHLLKLAMVVGVSNGELRGKGDVCGVISLRTMKDAMLMLDRVKEMMPLAFTSITENPISRGADKITEVLANYGGEMERSLLLRKVYYYLDKDSFEKAISLLEGMKRVRVETRGRKRWIILKTSA